MDFLYTVSVLPTMALCIGGLSSIGDFVLVLNRGLEDDWEVALGDD